VCIRIDRARYQRGSVDAIRRLAYRPITQEPCKKEERTWLEY